MKVRSIFAFDAPQVAILSAQLGYANDVEDVRRRLEAIGSKADHWILGVEGRESLVGFIHFFERASIERGLDMVVQSLVVEARHRVVGVGRLLMQAVETTAKARSITSVILSSRIDRPDAHAFYEALGYTVLATSRVFVKVLK